MNNKSLQSRSGHDRTIRHLQGYMLLLSGTIVALMTLIGSMTAESMTVWAYPAQQATYQLSPLSPLTNSISSTVTNPVVVTPLVAPTVATSVVTTHSQISLFLVGAVFIGILLVTIMVIGRRG